VNDTDADVIRRFNERCDDEKAHMERASSAAAIAEMAGLPVWKVFKVVTMDLEKIVEEELGKRPSHEDLMSIITESIVYARELTREDGFKAVWKQRRMRDLKSFIKDYTAK
jgi:hypothetical protein